MAKLLETGSNRHAKDVRTRAIGQPEEKEYGITDILKAGTFVLGNRQVARMGYGAMQLAGRGVFGPPTARTPWRIRLRRQALAETGAGDDLSPLASPGRRCLPNIS